MKKALLLLWAGTMLVAAGAQTPVNRSMALVQKATATWCAPCGAWGWPLQEEIMADNMSGATPNALVLSNYGALGSNYRNGTADSLSWWALSLPNWAVNQTRVMGFNADGSINTITTRTLVKRAVDSFAAIAPVASTGFSYTISGNTITFNTRTKFWKAANGTYNLGVYILEDSVFGMQNGLPADDYHRNVFRGRISTGLYGDQIATGAIASGQTYTKNYTYTIKDTSWKKNRLRFFTVLWKKNGPDWDSWEVVNENHLKSAATSVNSLPAAVDQLIVYPNPATDRMHISGALQSPADARLSIINALGQTAYERIVPYRDGQLSEDILLGNFPNGVYTLLIRSEGAQTLHKLIVAH